MVSIGTKLQQLDGLRGTPYLNMWVEGFLVRIMKVTDGGKNTTMLTSKQIEVIEDNWRRHFA